MDNGVESWRLLNLIRAYSKHKEPLEAGDVTKLGLIADGPCDLHDVCRALEQGCPLGTALNIFT